MSAVADSPNIDDPRGSMDVAGCSGRAIYWGCFTTLKELSKYVLWGCEFIDGGLCELC